MKQYLKSLILTLLYAPISLLLLWQLSEHTERFFEYTSYAGYQHSITIGLLVLALLVALVISVRLLGRHLSSSVLLLITLVGVQLYLSTPLTPVRDELAIEPIAISDIQTQQQDRIWRKIHTHEISPRLVDQSLKDAPILLVTRSGQTLLTEEHGEDEYVELGGNVRLHVMRLYGEQHWPKRDIAADSPLTMLDFTVYMLPSEKTKQLHSISLWLMGGGALLLLLSLVRRFGRKYEYSWASLILITPLLAVVAVGAILVVPFLLPFFFVAELHTAVLIQELSLQNLIEAALSMTLFLLIGSLPFIIVFALNTARSYFTLSLLVLGAAGGVFYFTTLAQHDASQHTLTIPASSQIATTFSSPQHPHKIELARLYSDAELGEKASIALFSTGDSDPSRVGLHQGERASLSDFYLTVDSIKPQQASSVITCSIIHWKDLTLVKQGFLLFCLLLALASLAAPTMRKPRASK